jgi:hypothetical protein
MAGESRTEGGLILPTGTQRKKSADAKPFEVANDIDVYRRENGVPISVMLGACLLYAGTCLSTIGKQFETFDERMTHVENALLQKDEPQA